MTSRRLLVVNLYYAPDLASTGQYAADICASLARRGVSVHVVAGAPSYSPFAPPAPAYEIRDGVHVHRIPLGGARGRERMSTRLMAYFRFLWGAWRKAAELVKSEHPDALLTFHNPPLVGLIGAQIARRHRLRYTYAFYDIHPDVLVKTGWVRLPGPLLWLWRRLNRWIAAEAGAIIVIGDNMKRTLVEGHRVPAQKVEVIPLWGRPELTPVPAGQELRRELGVHNGEILLLYSGNMGIMHPLERILDAAAARRSAPLRFLFIGDGAKRESLRARVDAEGLDRVSFLPFQEEKRFVEILAASDACFVALEQGLEGLAVPSRAFTILSAGRPLITLMSPEADIARLVEEGRCGWNATDAKELERILEDVVRLPQELPERGRRGRELYDQRFKRDRVLEQYVRVVLGTNSHGAGDGTA
jgi:colanic acid biosynthesis glycosyl transferase WcaI